MSPRWAARHLDVAPGIDRVILPGHCRGDLEPVGEKAGTAVELGPEDLRDLPRHFAESDARREGYGAQRIRDRLSGQPYRIVWTQAVRGAATIER